MPEKKPKYEYYPKATYVTWSDDASRASAMDSMSKALESEVHLIDRSKAYLSRDFSDLQSNVSSRPGFTRRDYEYFRDDEAIPTTKEGIIAAADAAYQTVGLIRNIIDLMSDFACQGIRLSHPNRRIDKFYNNWFDRVKGTDRSERFLNNLYRTAQVVVHKQTAKLTLADRVNIQKALAQPDVSTPLTDEVEPLVIPWKYTFLNPATVQVIGGPLAFFIGKPQYALKLPENLKRMIAYPDKETTKLVSRLPQIVRDAAKTSGSVPLDPEKISVYYYKKDDWQESANPMIYAILADILLLRKLKLADMAALDGAISNIRIFKLGNLEAKIAPAAGAFAKLASILQSNVGVGTIDLIWGPDIELIESKTSVHQFLGEEKYKPTLNNIYAGLGIPPTLTGTFGAAGTTNNFISLKTLTQRLEYGRRLLIDFWSKECVYVQKAMGFRLPPHVEFDYTNLADEDAEKALLIQLADRSLISDELLQRRFRAIPDLERVRLNRETRERETGKMVRKSSPYHDPQFDIALKKVVLQTGAVTSSEVGLKLEPKKKGEVPALVMRQAASPGGGFISQKKSGQPQQGRPKNSKDKEKRKEKTFKPRAELIQIWAVDAQEVIAQVINPEILKLFKKATMRRLTSEQITHSNKIKFDILCNLKPMSVVTSSLILETMGKPIAKAAHDRLSELSAQVSGELKRVLTLDEIKQLQRIVYMESVDES